MKLTTIFIVLLIIIQVISISNGMVNENGGDVKLNENDIQVLMKGFNISLDRNREIIYNITNGRHYTQLELLQNDRILGFFLDRVRDYFSDNGFDVLKFEEFVKALCNGLFICKIPIIGSITNFIIDGAGILLEAQCYRDYAANLPAKGGLQLTGITIPKLI